MNSNRVCNPHRTLALRHKPIPSPLLTHSTNMAEAEMPLKTSITGQHPNDKTPTPPPSTSQQFLKWGLSLLAAVSMISKPKATALTNAVILYSDRPSMIHLIEVFFTAVALLWAIALGGYGAWAFLSNLQAQGRARIGISRRHFWIWRVKFHVLTIWLAEGSEQQGKIAKS